MGVYRSLLASHEGICFDCVDVLGSHRLLREEEGREGKESGAGRKPGRTRRRMQGGVLHSEPRPTPPTPTSAPHRQCRSLCSSAPLVIPPSATTQDQREELRRRTRKRTTKEEIKETRETTVFSAAKSPNSTALSQAGQEMLRPVIRCLNSHREKSANRCHSRPATRSPARPATRWLSTDLSGRLGESVINLSQHYFRQTIIK